MPRRSPETIARAEAERARLDMLPMIARCAEPGCEDWVFEGTTAGCRAASVEHRDSAHPGLAAARAKARTATEKRRKAAAAKRQALQRKSFQSPAGAARGPEISRDDAILALRSVAAEKGRAPKSTEWSRERRKPRLATLYRLFGSWGEAMDAAGMKPYSRRARNAA